MRDGDLTPRVLCFTFYLLFLFGLRWVRPAPAGHPLKVTPSEEEHENLLHLTPGAEVRLEAPKAKKSFLVYLPTDYTPERSWPVIFCYHGYRGQATTWPFKAATHGKGFIILGMNYATEDYHLHLGLHRTDPERAFFDEALDIVSSHLNVDGELIFMGGFSQGGYSTSILGEQLLDRLAGLLILGAGRSLVDSYPPSANQIHGKPIFIGVGETDERHNPRAKAAVQIYKDWGAAVTFEEWKGIGHSFDRAKSTKLLDWLLTNGPLKQVTAKFAEARKAEAAGKLGRAYTLYHQLAQISQTHDTCLEASKAAKKLARQAEGQLAEAETVIVKKPYPEAARLLNQIAESYEGAVFSERARQRLKALLNAKADELEARAHAAEKAGNSAKALQLYKLYLTYFTEAIRYPEVRAHFNAVKTKLQGQKAN